MPANPQATDEMVEKAKEAFRKSSGLTIRGNVAMRAALEAALADHVVVPREPTRAMIEAGCENNPTQWNDNTDDGFAADVANDVYRAMISAAPLPQKEG